MKYEEIIDLMNTVKPGSNYTLIYESPLKIRAKVEGNPQVMKRVYRPVKFFVNPKNTKAFKELWGDPENAGISHHLQDELEWYEGEGVKNHFLLRNKFTNKLLLRCLTAKTKNYTVNSGTHYYLNGKEVSPDMLIDICPKKELDDTTPPIFNISIDKVVGIHRKEVK